ncbi:hypothetical protein ACFV3E_26020 [Streptomyces sp. NPDC059718]
MEPSPTGPDRLANGCPGALPAGGRVAYAAQAGAPSARLVACVLAVVPAVLAVRGYGLPGRVTIRGYVRTRVIARGRKEFAVARLRRWAAGR